MFNSRWLQIFSLFFILRARWMLHLGQLKLKQDQKHNSDDHSFSSKARLVVLSYLLTLYLLQSSRYQMLTREGIITARSRNRQFNSICPSQQPRNWKCGNQLQETSSISIGYRLLCGLYFIFWFGFHFRFYLWLCFIETCFGSFVSNKQTAN